MSSAEKVYLDHFSGSLGRFCPGVPDVPKEGTSVTKKPIFMPDVPVFGTSVTVGTEIRPGSRSYSHTLSAHRRNIRFPAVNADVQLAGKVVQCE